MVSIKTCDRGGMYNPCAHCLNYEKDEVCKTCRKFDNWVDKEEPPEESPKCNKSFDIINGVISFHEDGVYRVEIKGSIIRIEKETLNGDNKNM